MALLAAVSASTKAPLTTTETELQPSSSQMTADVGQGICYLDAKLCPNGASVDRDPSNHCAFPECPEFTSECIAGTRDCGNGVILQRDPSNYCFFPDCRHDVQQSLINLRRRYASINPFPSMVRQSQTKITGLQCDAE